MERTIARGLRGFTLAATLVAGGVVVVGGGSLVKGQQFGPPAPIQPDLSPEKLAHEIDAMRGFRFAERDAATDHLMQMDPSDREAIEDALAKETDPEVAIRLMRVAVHLYLKGQTRYSGETSLLGISLTTETVTAFSSQEINNASKHADADSRFPWQTAVTVAEVQPGFPAAEQLKPGDRIVAVAGRTFSLDTTILDFRRMVALVRPGQYLPLTLIRNGKVMDVQVRVAGVDESSEPLAEYVERRRAAATLYQSQLQIAAMGKPLLLARADR